MDPPIHITVKVPSRPLSEYRVKKANLLRTTAYITAITVE